MYIRKSKHAVQRFYWIYVFCMGAFLFLLLPLGIADAKGYIHFGAEDLGPVTACAPGETEFNFVARDYDTEVSVADAIITARVRDGFSGPIIAEVISVSPTPALCFDASPIAQWIFLSTAGSATHVDMAEQWGLVFDPAAAASIADRKMQVHMHVMPNGVQIASHVSPIGPWLNYDPSLQLEFFSIPTLHGTTRITNILGFDYNSTTDFGTSSGWIPVPGGGPGIYTVSPLGLADGWHQWTFIALFDGTLTSPILGMEGWESYGIDRADPTVSVSHIPAIPTDTSSVTISADGQDILSGLDWIEIWVDGALEQTCVYTGSTAIETCSVSIGPFSGGSTHTYYAVVRDRAGNQIDTILAASSFLVGTPPDATDLDDSLIACIPFAGFNVSWEFDDPDAGDYETGFQVQVDDDASFSPPFVHDSGFIAVPASTVFDGDRDEYVIPSGLFYDTNYFWRIKVWDNSGTPSSDWIEKNSPIKTRKHASPVPSFTFLPEKPTADEVIEFTENSTCYDNFNSPEPCSTIDTSPQPPIRYEWDFDNPSGIDCDSSVDSACRGDVSHTYNTLGIKEVLLRVTDELGDGLGSCEYTDSLNVIIPFPGWVEISPLL